MTKGYFITGTDTEIGKTTFSASLLDQLNAEKKQTIGLKPIASGCEITPDGLRNADALILQKHASIPLIYNEINPYPFQPPIAPHIAAEQVNIKLNVQDLVKKCRQVQSSYPQSHIIVEGVGGWCVPINRKETMADFAVALGLPIILVVGIRLGCINHSLLTWESIRQSGAPIKGWVANQIDPALTAYQENVNTLTHWLDAPLLKEMIYNTQQSPA